MRFSDNLPPVTPAPASNLVPINQNSNRYMSRLR